MQHTPCAGVKRKLASEDAGGVEREPKLAAVAGERSWRCCVQQQVLLQLSLQKLCRFAPHVETALARRVLIANTLRLLRDELGQQGAPPEAPEGGRGAGGVGQGTEPLSRAEDSLTPAWVLEQDEEAFQSRHSGPEHSPHLVAGTSPPASLAPKDSFCWALAEIEDLFSATNGDGAPSPACPLGASSSLFSSFSQSEPQHPPETGSRSSVPAVEMSERETQIHTGATGPTLCEPHLDSSHQAHLCSPAPFLGNHTPFSTVSSPSSTSFLPDLSLDDFLFSDFDNFRCEFNPCSSNLSPNPSPSPKAVSMVTDDIMEHIMEVLVGS